MLYWLKAIGMYGRMQQDGRIESFQVALLDPNGDLDGFIAIHGSTEQLTAVQQDEEFLRNTIDAELIVDKLRHVMGYTNDGVAPTNTGPGDFPGGEVRGDID